MGYIRTYFDAAGDLTRKEVYNFTPQLLGAVVAPILTLSATPGVKIGAFTVTVVASEPVTGLGLSDFIITNGVGSNFSGSGANYSFTVTPNDPFDGNTTIDLPAGRCLDLQGNLNLASTPLVVTVDTLHPLGVLSGPTSPQTTSFNVTVVFAEAVTGLAQTDFVINTGTINSLTGGPTTYTLSITPPASSTGNINVDLPAGQCQDANGNLNLVSSRLVIPYDTQAPTPSISGPSGTQTGPYQLSVNFAETITGLALSDFTVTNGTLSNLQGSGSTYTFTLTPPVDSVGISTVQLPAATVVDSANNNNLLSNLLSIPYDTTVFVPGNNPPSLVNSEHSVQENASLGTIVAVLSATDPDATDILNYNILSGNEAGDFAISQGGIITVAKALNYDVTPVYNFVVQVSDGTDSDVANVTINVIEIVSQQYTLIGLENFFPEIRTLFSTAHFALMMYQAREAVKTFCEKSWFWQEDLPDIALSDLTTVYRLPDLANRRVSDIIDLQLKDTQGGYVSIGRRKSKKQVYYRQLSSMILELVNRLENGYQGPMKVKVAYKPSETAVSVFEEIYHQYHDVIISGMKYRLYNMSNQSWYDKDEAAFYKSEFDYGCFKARRDVARGFSKSTRVLEKQPRDFF